MTTEREQWQAAAHRLLKIVIIVAIVVVLGAIAEFFLVKGAMKEMLQEIGSELFGGRGSDGSGTLTFIIIFALLFLFMLIMQFRYALLIRQFANIQTDDDERTLMNRASTGAYLQLAAPFVLIIALLSSNDAYVALFLIAVAWLIAMVGSAKMTIAFRNMRSSNMLTDSGKLGAENLRYAGICQQRLLVVPLVFVLFTAMMTMLFASSMKSTWGGAEFNVMSLGSLEHSVNDFGGRADSTMTEAKFMYYVYIMFTTVMAFCTLLWTILALVKPIMGWHRIMNGKAMAEGEEDDSVVSDWYSRVATALEKVKSWYYAVAIALLLLLPMLMPSCSSKSNNVIDDDIEYFDDDEYAAHHEDEDTEVETEDFDMPEGEVTEYVVENNEETYMNEVYAIKGDEKVNTGIELEFLHHIVDQHDYDGDGNVDLLVCTSPSPTQPGWAVIVYYDKVHGRFGEINDLDPNITAEEVDGVWTIVEKEGVFFKRYGLFLGHLITIEDKTIDVGETKIIYTLESIFQNVEYLGAEAKKDYPIDLNDDGISERVHFGTQWGRLSLLLNSTGFASNGREYKWDDDEYCIVGDLNVMEHTTQGWHDVMVKDVWDHTYLYRWNGNGYSEVTP